MVARFITHHPARCITIGKGTETPIQYCYVVASTSALPYYGIGRTDDVELFVENVGKAEQDGGGNDKEDVDATGSDGNDDNVNKGDEDGEKKEGSSKEREVREREREERRKGNARRKQALRDIVDGIGNEVEMKIIRENQKEDREEIEKGGDHDNLNRDRGAPHESGDHQRHSFATSPHFTLSSLQKLYMQIAETRYYDLDPSDSEYEYSMNGCRELNSLVENMRGKGREEEERGSNSVQGDNTLRMNPIVDNQVNDYELENENCEQLSEVAICPSQLITQISSGI